MAAGFLQCFDNYNFSLFFHQSESISETQKTPTLLRCLRQTQVCEPNVTRHIIFCSLQELESAEIHLCWFTECIDRTLRSPSGVTESGRRESSPLASSMQKLSLYFTYGPPRSLYFGFSILLVFSRLLFFAFFGVI